MSSHVAKVVKVTPKTVWLQAQRTTSCGGCEQKSGCGVSSISQLFNQKSITFTAANTFPVAAQDTVLVQYEEGALVQAALKAYIWPVLLFFLFGFGGTFLNYWLSLGSEWLVIGCAFLGLAVAAWLIRRVQLPQVTIACRLTSLL